MRLQLVVLAGPRTPTLPTRVPPPPPLPRPPARRCALQGTVTPAGYVMIVVERVATNQAMWRRTGLITLSGLDHRGVVRWVRTCRAAPLARRARVAPPSDNAELAKELDMAAQAAVYRWFGTARCQLFVGRAAAGRTVRVAVRYRV